MKELHDSLINNSLIEVSSNTHIKLLSKVHHHCAIVYNLFKLDEELITDIIFSEKRIIRILFNFTLLVFTIRIFQIPWLNIWSHIPTPKILKLKRH